MHTSSHPTLATQPAPTALTQHNVQRIEGLSSQDQAYRGRNMYNNIHRSASERASFSLTTRITSSEKTVVCCYCPAYLRIIFFRYRYCTTVVVVLHNFLNIRIPVGLPAHLLSCFLEILHYSSTRYYSKTCWILSPKCSAFAVLYLGIASFRYRTTGMITFRRYALRISEAFNDMLTERSMEAASLTAPSPGRIQVDAVDGFGC